MITFVCRQTINHLRWSVILTVPCNKSTSLHINKVLHPLFLAAETSFESNIQSILMLRVACI